MVAFRLSPEVLGQTRFAFSPLAEAGSALHLLAVPHVGSVHQGWIDRARRATADLDMDLLTSLVNSCTWLPTFLYQPATSPDTGFDTQLSLLEQAGIDRVSADLQEVWSGREMPPGWPGCRAARFLGGGMAGAPSPGLNLLRRTDITGHGRRPGRTPVRIGQRPWLPGRRAGLPWDLACVGEAPCQRASA